ncbi:hypothetical protein HDU99_006554, partial [Rhizoclosmatium hyalinum]
MLDHMGSYLISSNFDASERNYLERWRDVAGSKLPVDDAMTIGDIEAREDVGGVPVLVSGEDYSICVTSENQEN